ncbi:MAG: hypothetical protein LBC77_08440 [Spirochaetaceae bacterium]|jgi:hypothetical protein|nr:hypothetical protein [Spirochaetaceae bacterium]
MNNEKTFPLAVKTKQAVVPIDIAKQRAQLYASFDEYTFDTLRKIPLPCKTAVKGNKAMTLNTLAHFFAFQDKASVETWLMLFPPEAQKTLYKLAFSGCAVIESKFDARLRLDFLSLRKFTSNLIIILQPVFRDILLPWLEPLPEATLDECVCDGAGKEIYSNANEIYSSFPLLCEAIYANPEMIAANNSIPSLSKKTVKQLRSDCGYKPFPFSNNKATLDKTPESLDLAARFIICMSDFNVVRCNDGFTGVKKLVNIFFGSEAAHGQTRYTRIFDFFESYVLTPHLKKRGLYYGYYSEVPPSRVIFLEVMKEIAKDGRWFSASALARYMYMTKKQFRFLPPGHEEYMYIRADYINAGGSTYCYDYGASDFFPSFTLRYYMLVEPLFKAYCYLFAALGILEITQAVPQAAVSINDKSKPFSIFDSLDTMRVTDFGRWCLDVSGEQPRRESELCEAIADSELLLVTVHGKSFEREVYLDSIGERLGGSRWRVSPRSFVADCVNIGDIKKRVDKFKRLIDAAPAPHWQRLFLNAVERAGFNSKNIIPAEVYKLAGDDGLADEILRDPELSSTALRAEGGLLVVPASMHKKFRELLSKHGIALFD